MPPLDWFILHGIHRNRIRFNSTSLFFLISLSIEQLLVVLPVIFLFMEVVPSLGFRRYKKPFPTRLPNVITKEQCGKVWPKLPSKRFSRFLRGPVCTRPNDTVLFEKLKDIGGFNPRYVAINRTEAMKFPNLLADRNSVAVTRPPKLHTVKASVSHYSVGKKIGKREADNLPRAAGTILDQQCFDAGSIVEGSGLRRLCSECSAITQLPDDIFPRFINEIICEESSESCGSPLIGLCQQRNLEFRFLQFTGNFRRNFLLSLILNLDVFVEDTVEFDQDVRGCCECRTFTAWIIFKSARRGNELFFMKFNFSSDLFPSSLYWCAIYFREALTKTLSFHYLLDFARLVGKSPTWRISKGSGI